MPILLQPKGPDKKLSGTGLCKPVATQHTPAIAFRKYFPDRSFSIAIRMLDIDTDIPVVFGWVNEEYAKRFWQMDNQPVQQLKQTYRLILASDFAQSFIGLLNGSPICQVDVYNALRDEVSLLYPARQGDYGLHFLMAPRRQRIPGLSACVFSTFVEFLFSYPEVQRIIGEPDAENAAANKLVKNAGFSFQQTIGMSYKTANLYYCTREDYGRASNQSIH